MHTATAFMGAAFLWEEYKDASVWIGITGYAIASGTAFLRMYNNKHWFADVVAGAGIGILGTKIACFVFPFVNKILFNESNASTESVILPFL